MKSLYKIEIEVPVTTHNKVNRKADIFTFV